MKYLLFLMCFFLAQPTPFAENATLLTYDNHELWVSISDTGNTIIATANQYEPVEGSNSQFRIVHRAIALWDVATLPEEGGTIAPTATYNIELQDRIGTMLSPDDRFLALLINDQLQIMSVPDLEVLEVFPEFASTDSTFWFGADSMDWSPDGELLASIAGGKILLWDGEELQTLIETHAQGIYATPNGWLLHTFDDSNIAFMECDQLFEVCETYIESEDEVFQQTQVNYASQLDMLYVLHRESGYYRDDRSVWTRDENGIFQQQPWIIENGYSYGFSTSGTYLVSRAENTDSNLFWRVEDVSQPEFSLPFFPMGREFLPGDEYLIEFSTSDGTLSVYDLGYNLQMVYDLSQQFNVSDYYVHDLIGASILNNRYYLNLGNAVVVIPLETR